jgi:hypothetical protein
VDISVKKEVSFERYIHNLEKNSENRNITNLYRGINKFKKCYRPRAKLVDIRIVACLQIPTVICIGGRITSVSYGMFMMLIRLEVYKYIQLTQKCP